MRGEPLGKDFREDHMIFRGNGGKSVVANRVSRGDCRKMTVNEGGGEGFLGGSHDFQGERRGISRR